MVSVRLRARRWPRCHYGRGDDMTPPNLKLRRTWHDGGQPREDYEVVDARGERVGRMYRTEAVGGGGPGAGRCTASR
jgi:hypothetical protein